MKRPNILVVNDDGIASEGIRLLAEKAAHFGDVWIVAPAEQCSGMSQRITIFEPLPIRKEPFPVEVKGAWSVGGTPADCVKAAVNRLLPVEPDYLFSGINHGYNAGFDVAYSGTIGAAMEGLMKGIPSFAFSSDFNSDFSLVEREILPILEELLSRPIERNALWNVNFPGCKIEEYRGILRGRRLAEMQLYLDRYGFEEQPDRRLWMVNRSIPAPADLAPEGTDIHAVLNGFISIGKVFCKVLSAE